MPAPKIKDPVTEHRKQIIKARWEAGASVGQISRELGITRNTVSGHVWRLKLPQRTQDSIRQQGRANASKQKANPKGFALALIGGGGVSRDKTKAAPVKIETVEVAEPFRIDGALVTLETLNSSRMCSYPIGEVLEPGFHYCANPLHPGTPYCEGHHKRCTQPQTGVSRIDAKIIRNSGINRALG